MASLTAIMAPGFWNGTPGYSGDAAGLYKYYMDQGYTIDPYGGVTAQDPGAGPEDAALTQQWGGQTGQTVQVALANGNLGGFDKNGNLIDLGRPLAQGSGLGQFMNDYGVAIAGALLGAMAFGPALTAGESLPGASTAGATSTAGADLSTIPGLDTAFESGATMSSLQNAALTAGYTTSEIAGLSAAELAALPKVAEMIATGTTPLGTPMIPPGPNTVNGPVSIAPPVPQIPGDGTIPTTPTTPTNTPTGTSILPKLPDGSIDWAKLAGSLAPSLLGAYASNQQASALKDLADKYMAMGAPYRDQLSALMANPSSYLTSSEVTVPVQQGTNALARSLSTSGNPVGSGNALQELQSYSTNQLYGQLQNKENQLAGFGGLTNYNAAAPAAAQTAIGANANTYNAIGSGIANIFNPPQTLAQTLAQYKQLTSGF